MTLSAAPPKPLASLLSLALMTWGLCACGTTVSTSSFKGEEKAVAQRIADFQSNATAIDEQKVCQNDLASVVLARLRVAGGRCEAALKTQLGVVDDFELKVESIAVAGTHASARVKSTWSGKSRSSTMVLVREGGAWKISELQ
jgi:hypothetical protein